MFLTRKPMLYVLNLGDEEAPEIDRVIEKYHLEKLASKPHTAVVPFCGKIEAELAELDDAEAAEMMSAYGLAESGRDRLIQASYRLLGLISFLTCGEPECRAWTIERGMTAQQAAGAIHSDIERGFIKADVVKWEDLLNAGSFAAAQGKSAGAARRQRVHRAGWRRDFVPALGLAAIFSRQLHAFAATTRDPAGAAAGR